MKSQGEAVSKRVIGCGYEVSNELGAGFFEAVYEQAPCLELKRQGLSLERQLRKRRVGPAPPNDSADIENIGGAGLHPTWTLATGPGFEMQKHLEIGYKGHIVGHSVAQFRHTTIGCAQTRVAA